MRRQWSARLRGGRGDAAAVVGAAAWRVHYAQRPTSGEVAMKRLLLVSLALVLALSLTACGGGGTAPGGDTGSSPDSAGSAGGASGGTATDDGIATVEDLKALLAEEHADAEWYADVTDVTVETMLGAPVLAFHMTWSSTSGDFDALNSKTMALGDLMGSLEQSVAPNVVLVYTDDTVGDLYGSGGPGIAMMADAFALPPAPTTAEGVAEWLETVYGPGGLVELGPDETWYAAIESITMQSLYGGQTLVVETSAPSIQSLDASLVNRALMSTGSPLLESYEIRAADGTVSSGFAQTLVGTGFLYPVE